MQEFHYEGAQLTCEDVPLTQVAQRFGTPLYVYSKESIVDHCRHLEKAFNGQAHTTCYAVKANSNRAILEIIKDQGFGADVNSQGELFLALQAGFDPDRVTFSGVGKQDDEIRYALKNKIYAFNVESREEIEVLNSIAGAMGKVGRILLRVNLDIDAGGHAYISTSLKQNKFGVSLREAREILQWAKALPNIEIRGLHSHIGSQIQKVETFASAAKVLVEFIKDLRSSGLVIHELDFGGGFGVQYRGYIRHEQLPQEGGEEMNISAAVLVKTVLPLLQEAACAIAIQPGRSIIAHPGVLITKVLYRKQTEEKLFVIVDGGMNDLLRPSLYNAYHQLVPLELKNRPHEVADIVGPLCETGDFFARDRLVPQLHRGEYAALMCAGAYGYALSSNYNARPRPAEILVDGSAMRVIRERETLNDL